MATSDKLQKLLETKEQIRQAIIDKGVEIGEDVVFANYSNKIAAIESSGGGSLTKEQSDIINAWNQRTINGTSLESLYSNYYKNSSGNVVDLDLQYIDFSKVTTISSMFSNNSIKSINIRNMDTSNINIMSFLFYQVTILTELDLSDWYTPNVTSVKYMFGLCRSLETVNISNFDLTNCSSASYIFQNCSELHTLRLDNCSNDTINKIITSSGFPTGTIDGVARQIFVKAENIGDLTAPDGWEFVNVE